MFKKPFTTKADGFGFAEGPISVAREPWGDSLSLSLFAGDGKKGRYNTRIFGGKIQTSLFVDGKREEVTDPQILADQKALYLAAFASATMARLSQALDAYEEEVEENAKKNGKKIRTARDRRQEEETEGHSEAEIARSQRKATSNR